jgi:hypothetical protein
MGKQPVETGTADADDDGTTIFSCILVAPGGRRRTPSAAFIDAIALVSVSPLTTTSARTVSFRFGLAIMLEGA